MTQIESYPVIRTDEFARTVAFYEDLFGLAPDFETEGFVRLRDVGTGKIMLTVVEKNHEFLPEGLLGGHEGQVMSVMVDNFDAMYDFLYMEGLQIIKEPGHYGEGGRHFMVADPHNPVVINIVACEAGRSCCGESGDCCPVG